VRRAAGKQKRQEGQKQQNPFLAFFAILALFVSVSSVPIQPRFW
jgi:hypothetical protein